MISPFIHIIVASMHYTLAYAHSWVGCTNYAATSTNYLTLGDFDRSKCRGYPRKFQNQYNQELVSGWGIDTGYDWEHDTCRIPFNSGDYTDTTPMAIYYSNEIIHISHPAKGHVADDTCTNRFIGSTSMKLKMSKVSKQDTFDVDVPMVGGDHQPGVVDHLGYQNCYKFCDNKDKAHCLTSWQLPVVTVAGRYSFIWLWEFNPGQVYSSCFDALILLSPNTNASTVDNDTVVFTSTTPSTGVPSPTLTSIQPSTGVPTPSTPTPSTPTSSTPIPTPTPSLTTSTPTSTSIPTPSLTTSTPTSTPIPIITIPTETPIEEPTSTPTPTSTFPIITSDANQIKSIFTDLFKSIRFAFNGTLNFTMLP